ncbi:MAG: HAMP domain-containing sensor histidine kinase [Burkholderiaceae bacterium]|nr:HAMP domain-containing sensor histidine kinase [Burkholderiaceae bacterium]MDZ4145871.1 HAMP domain-containing sensor histidine kinase [Burkholderiales bacterium]
MTDMRPENKINDPGKNEVGPLFLANFVHQIVNPINGVIGTLDNINDGTYSGSVVNQKINASRAQLEQCVSLIRNLAYLSDYFFEHSGKDALKPARQGGISVLPQVVIEAAQFFQVAGDKRKIKIELTDKLSQYKISVRPELLKQVFMNLFDNWLKYGQSEQTIEITPTVNKARDLIIEVTGASIGFHNTDAEKIFELGFRSKSAESTVAQGSGIGLYVCRQILEQNLGGCIKASHQQKNSITKFRISIPKQKWQI